MKRAVESTIKIKKDNPNKNISVLGELIHNSHVINELNNLGIKTLNCLPECGEGVCIIRSHGESMDVFDEIQSKGYEIADLTCLDVKKVQKKAVEFIENGYFLIILGKKEHPEVKAIEANALRSAKNKDMVFVAENINSLYSIEDKLKKSKKTGLVLQTTQTIEYLIEVCNYLSGICKYLNIQNTICPSTTLRQNEAKDLAKESDLMVVVGSKKSANTTHLAELLKKITKTIHIESDYELNDYTDIIQKANKIGVTAGASTPDSIINKVIDKLNKYN